MTKEARIAARKELQEKDEDKNRPDCVTVVPCLYLDIKALVVLSAYENLPELSLWTINSKPVFIIGDSSEPGFGLVFWRQGEMLMNAEVRRWR